MATHLDSPWFHICSSSNSQFELLLHTLSSAIYLHSTDNAPFPQMSYSCVSRCHSVADTSRATFDDEFRLSLLSARILLQYTLSHCEYGQTLFFVHIGFQQTVYIPQTIYIPQTLFPLRPATSAGIVYYYVNEREKRARRERRERLSIIPGPKGDQREDERGKVVTRRHSSGIVHKTYNR